ncbi:MAG: hypothetical protein CMD29_02195 [Flavobacteriales bacterium]|nr:hypothetical protein [Flavobacteriales bacterium]|tara:strand:+ start:680 stop:1015 length:336 start_codon:yes stop_codon:yes gene_type:complete
MNKIIIYIDEGCGICKKTSRVLKPIVIKNLVIFKFAKDMNFDPNSEPMQKRYIDLYSYDGEFFYSGYQTYLEITRRSILLFPLHLLMRIGIIRKIGEKIYRKIADLRACKV